MLRNSIFAMGVCVSLVSCGGGGSSGGGNNSPSTETGVFLDSAVVNIGYRTETLEGITNSSGEYEYLEGETVTFFIGDLELPPVTATGIVTPLDIADSDDISNSTVVNIIRLLQTLDEDGNPDNGIAITDTAKNSATQVDFALSVSAFEASSAVTNLVANSGSSNVVLISSVDAISHFEEQLEDNGISFGSLVGIWRATNTTNNFVSLAFFDDGTYLYTVYDSNSPDSESGMELGTYALNGETNLLTANQTIDFNGGRGLSENIQHFLDIYGDSITVTFDDNGNGTSDDGESVVFEKALGSDEVGLWRATNTTNDFVSLAFFDDETYLYAVYDSNSSDSESGMELGTYTLNSETGLLTTNQTIDFNGGRGFSENIQHFLEINGNSITVTFDDNGNGTSDEGESVAFGR